MRVKRKNGLTDKQEAFCQARAKGMTQVDAYRAAGYSQKQKPEAFSCNARQLGRLDYIKNRIAELQAQVDAGAILDVKQIAADLAVIAGDENKPDGVRLKAYDQLTRILGGYNDTTAVTLSAALSLDDTRAAIESLFDD